MSNTWVSLGLLVLAQCHHDELRHDSSPRASASSSSPAASNAAPMTSVEDAMAAVDAAAPTFDVYADLKPSDFSSRKLGFTDDDTYLFEAVSKCDPCPLGFHGVSPTKPPITLAYFWHPDWTTKLGDEAVERMRKKNDDAVDAKLQALGVVAGFSRGPLRGPFPFADLRFETSHTVNAAAGTKTLLFGAKSAGEDAVYPMHVTLGPHPSRHLDPKDDWLHEPELAYVNVTRDGRDIGIVASVFGTMWWEDSGVARMPAVSFAAAVYDGMGLHHRAKDDVAALHWFEKAVATSPSNALYADHLNAARATRDQ